MMESEILPNEKHFPARLTVYCIAHFLIDLASTFIIVGYIFLDHNDLSAYMLFYGIAFCGQMPLGLFADKFNHNAWIASAGCLLMIIATGLIYIPGDPLFYTVVILGGLGNALVHIGGGVDVLNHSKTKCGPLGIFVCPGFIGVFAAVLLSSHGIYLPIITSVLLAGVALCILILQKRTFGDMCSRNVPLSLKISVDCPKAWAILAIASLFIVVFLRSYVGFILPFDWKSVLKWNVLLILAIGCGKAFGGVLSDKFGMRRTAIVSLCMVAILFLFPSIPVVGVLSIFLFNMTLPMTLWALSRIFNHARGFAFGTLTLSLYLGLCLYIYPLYYPALILSGNWACSVAAILSLILLCIGIKPIQRS